MTYGTLIQTVTVGAGGASSIDLTSIPQTFTDILIVYSLRDNLSGISNDATLTVNGSLITFRQLYGTGVNVGSNNPAQIARPIVSATGPANTFGNTQVYISNYSSTTQNKPIAVDSVCENNASESYQVLGAGLLSSTSAVTSVSLDNGTYTFSQGSTASLYGINPIPAATQGTTPTVDYLVVAGGGGGGGNEGSGGGAGGYRTSITGEMSGGGVAASSSLAVTSGTALTVTVGAGGTGGGAGANGTAGSDSVFSTITSTGGGRGVYNTSGGAGGSGGGASYNWAVGSGTTGQGYAGGLSITPNWFGGGGGGAGGVGSSSGSTGGNGGAGVTSTINGFSQTRAGGGGGGSNTGGAVGTGGSGGAGNGGGVSALANTGSGGGGGYWNGSSGTSGGAGGSGIVIIRYPVTYNPPSATTGNPAVNYINGYRVYTWYNSGSITF